MLGKFWKKNYGFEDFVTIKNLFEFCFDHPRLLHFPLLKSHCILYLSFSITTSSLFLYHLSFTSIPYFLHIFQWIFFPSNHVVFYTPFGLTCYIRLAHDFTISPVFAHILHLLFSCNLCFYLGSYSLFLRGHY